MTQWKKVEATEIWNFHEEEELIGEFVEGEAGVGPNKSNLYTFRKQNNDLIAVWGNTILDSRFKQIEKGDLVRIVYKGKTVSEKTGREYHDFDVYCAKSEGNDVKNEDIPVIEDEK